MPESSANIASHTKALQAFLCEFLEQCLPGICATGSDWWQVMVRPARMKGAQKSRVRNGLIRKMQDLDLVSLCSLLSHHWEVIARNQEIDDPQNEARVLCDMIINLRNRLSHEGTGNRLTKEEELHALLGLSKLASILKAPPEFLDGITESKQLLMRELVPSAPAASGSSVSGTLPAHTPEPQILNRFLMEDQGIPLDIISGSGEQKSELDETLSSSTFVGIDFGTSTTVASRVFFDAERETLATEPIPIPQIDRLGRTIEDYLVPSCLSYVDENLLVGQGAAELKPDLSPGKNTWFSFKMDLGIDQGCAYPHSLLDGNDGRPELRRPQDAAVLFFKYLREHIEAWVREQKLPGDIRYAVSVPASFEANQRLDLCRVMQEAGMDVEDNAIIDEPNAAFINHLLESLGVGTGIVNSFRDRTVNALVFDFGAGTCDISILEVTGKEDRVVSRNLAISQFRALGGDNIDRQIVRKVLWPRIEKDCLQEGQRIRKSQFDQIVVPRLQPVAEILKIQCCKWLTSRTQGGDLSIHRDSEVEITEAPINPIRIGPDITLKLDQPSISIREFFEIMEPFLADPGEHAGEGDVISVIEPVQSALQKADLSKDDLDMVLFIGGSAQNPLVQECIGNYMGRFVECVIGDDVRTPVSRGAALHSLVWNGMDFQFIRPITSETIFILTVGEKLHPIIQAGSPIPSPESVFIDNIIVAHPSQRKVELPICVSTASKILHTLELYPPNAGCFEAGDRITISARLDENKLLQIKAKLGSVIARGELINPLANKALTSTETARLEARRELNQTMVRNGGRPDPQALRRFAQACAASGAHLEAAETFEALYRREDSLSPEDKSKLATSICYHYSKCDRNALSDKWAEESYRCKPNWANAYNLSLTRQAAGDHDAALQLLREADRLGPNQPSVLTSMGNLLLRQGDPKEGQAMLQKALGIYRIWMSTGVMRREDATRARILGEKLGEHDFLRELSTLQNRLALEDQAYSEEYLAASLDNERQES